MPGEVDGPSAGTEAEAGRRDEARGGRLAEPGVKEQRYDDSDSESTGFVGNRFVRKDGIGRSNRKNDAAAFVTDALPEGSEVRQESGLCRNTVSSVRIGACRSFLSPTLRREIRRLPCFVRNRVCAGIRYRAFESGGVSVAFVADASPEDSDGRDTETGVGSIREPAPVSMFCRMTASSFRRPSSDPAARRNAVLPGRTRQTSRERTYGEIIGRSVRPAEKKLWGR